MQGAYLLRLPQLVFSVVIRQRRSLSSGKLLETYKKAGMRGETKDVSKTNTKEVVVPPLGESVSEATVGIWHKKEGDVVNEDTDLLELETDKITLEVNPPDVGMLKSIQVKSGDTVKVGQVLGTIDTSPEAKSKAKKTIESAVSKAASQTGTEGSQRSDSQSSAQEQRRGQTDPLTSSRNYSEHGGAGANLRLSREDTLSALKEQGLAKFDSPKISRPSEQEERVPMSRLRLKIAERLKEAQNTAAILTTFNEVDMSAITALRAQHKETFEKKHGVRLGFMSFFVKACVKALADFPALNAEIQGTDVIYKHYCHMGVAVGTDKGLVVPVLRHAETMTFASIEKTIRGFADKVKDNTLRPEDLAGGTFSISNGGVYGSLLSTPILNPPQSGILGMHSIQERPVVRSGQVVIRPMMYVALSYDHRIVDGREAVTFLARMKEKLESPASLLLET
jgi:2-oxoglutarate dehydrogenase E2 component (dihydrolipoamide succinyltransferase)